jgi:hypothetical protein
MLFQLGCGRQSRPYQFCNLTTLIEAKSAPQRSKFLDLAPLEPHQAFGTAMEIATASLAALGAIRTHAPADCRNPYHRILIIATHAAETGAKRLFT